MNRTTTSRPRPYPAVAVLVAWVLAGLGCGAVAVPGVRSYRLPLAAGASTQATQGRVLRVHDLRLAAHVSPESLMVADGPNLLQAHPLDLWAGPLDRMVTDVVVRSLRRSGAFADVKGSGDVGSEDLSLSATVTDFHYERHDATADAVVGFDVQIRRARDHALLLAGEWGARVPLSDVTATAAVRALGQGVQKVVQQLVAACAELPAEVPAGARGVGPGLAAPPHGR